MKKLLLAILLLAAYYTGHSQCATNFSTTMAPQNNSLLRVAFNITSTPTTLPSGKIKYHYISWGDATPVVNVTNGTYYHTYTTAGTYTPYLYFIILDSTTSTLYCSDTEYHAITVSYTTCATSYSTSVSGMVATVTATTPAGATGMSYSWNWGDGSPASSGNPASHTYSTAGVKTITLTATGGSCSYTNVQTATIAVPCSSLNSDYTYSISGATVSFTNISTNTAGKYRNSYWTYGDGGFAANNATVHSHTYASSGTYNVKLVTQWIDSISKTVYCSDTETKTITFTVPNVISGSIIQDSTKLVASPVYKVWLIVFDSATNILSAVDSVTVTGSSSGISTPYQFTGKPAGIYRVKTKMLNGPTSGFGAVPTYATSEIMWNSSGINLVYHTGGASLYKNIYLQYGTVTSGPGFIGGSVLAGANKGTSTGIANMTVLLLAPNGTAIASATTDANGNYSFSNLAPSSYYVHPEDAGYTTTPVNVIVLNSIPTINNINFTRSVSKQTITPSATGIVNINTTPEFIMYPNPAKDKVTIEWASSLSKSVRVIVTDITGKTINTTTVETNGKAQINFEQLHKGFYFVTIEADGSRQTQKLVLE